MKTVFKSLFILVLMMGLFETNSHAQYATRKVSKRQQAYTDSLKKVEYNYVFPILGQQAYSRGFDIPYPAGLMGNFIWMDQGIILENFQLGISGGSGGNELPMQPIDFIGFGDNKNTSYAANFRPDLWIFPFLNVYGLIGYGSSRTEVNLVEPVVMKSVVEQGMATYGIGMMGAFGIGPLWMSIDANWTWTYPELLEDPVKVRVLGLRLGKTFAFRQHPERNIAIWAGGMRARMGSTTVGAIKMSDALPPETWDRADEIHTNYWDWVNGLPDGGFKDRVLESPFTEFINRVGASDGNAVVSYSMDKKPVEEWNVVVGGQFQINKSWMLRTEAGIIGDRKSWLASINYRFKI